MTLLKEELVTGGLEKTGIMPSSKVNMDVKIVCNNSALRVGSMTKSPLIALSGPIRVLDVNLRLELVDIIRIDNSIFDINMVSINSRTAKRSQ